MAAAAAPAGSPSRRRKAREFLRDNWPRVAWTLFFLTVFFGNQGFRGLVRNYMELRALHGQISALQKQEADSEERLRLLRSGDGSVERLARRELGYVRKGEIEYRFPPPAPDKQ